MTTTLNDLLKQLETMGIPYSVVPASNDHQQARQYRFASTKNKIEGGIYFLAGEYITQGESIRESIILCEKTDSVVPSNTYILVENPQLAHYKLASISNGPVLKGIHPTAIVDPRARVHESAYIGPFCIIGDCEIGAKVALLSAVTVNDNTVIMQNVIIEGNSVIGARGMAWIWDENGNRIMQPQLGGVVIEEDCIIGTDITIVRGSMTENTIIGKGTVIAHGSKIGHGCRVGAAVHFANNVSLAGNVVLHSRVFLGSGCVISSNVEIADGCIVGAGSVVNKSVTEKYVTIVGVPGKVIKNNNFENKPRGAPQPFKK